MLLTALLIHGVQTGPLKNVSHPDVFCGVVSSMYADNFMRPVLNLPLIGVFVSFLRIPIGMTNHAIQSRP